MMNINVPKVRGKMAEQGLSISALSGKLGINRNTLAFYLNNPSKTPYGVVSEMASILCESKDEAEQIFFSSGFRNKKE